MARADSSIRVNIIGDAKSLQGAAKDADKSLGKIGGSAKALAVGLGGLFAADKLLDFTQSALGEADRLGDATARLEASLGDLAGPLEDAAGGLENLGQSRQDVLELEARFVDLGTAAGLAADQLAKAAPTATEASAALALLGVGGGDAATVLDLIGKAVGGADKPLKELGITLSDAEVEARALADTGKTSADALTEQELAAARFALVMEKLQPKISAVTDGEADLETRQAALQAKFETFTGKVGDAVDGPLTDLLTFLIAIGDATGTATDAFATFRLRLDQLEGPTRDYVELLRQIFDLFGKINPALGLGGAVFGAPSANRVPSNSAPHPGITVQVQGGSPEVIEQAVRDAIAHARNSGGI